MWHETEELQRRKWTSEQLSEANPKHKNHSAKDEVLHQDLESYYIDNFNEMSSIQN